MTREDNCTAKGDIGGLPAPCRASVRRGRATKEGCRTTAAEQETTERMCQKAHEDARSPTYKTTSRLIHYRAFDGWPNAYADHVF